MVYSINSFRQSINLTNISAKVVGAPRWAAGVLIRISSVFFKALKTAGSGMSTFVATKVKRITYFQGAGEQGDYVLFDCQKNNGSYLHVVENFGLN